MRRFTSGARRHGLRQDGTTRALAERLAAVERLMVDQQERIAQQAQEIARLRAEAGETPETPALILPASTRGDASAAKTSAGGANEGGARSSRRTLLKYGGAAAAAGVAAGALGLANGGAAHAQGRGVALPETVINWTTNSFSVDAETVVTPSGGYSALDVLQVQIGSGTVYSPTTLKAAITAYDTTTNSIGLYASSSTGYGLYGVTDSGHGATGAGLSGTANTGTGVAGTSTAGVGVLGNSTNGLGGSFSGGQAPIALAFGGTSGAPTGGNHVEGEIYADNVGDLWVCTFTGSPGNWSRLASVPSGTPGGVVTYLSKPVRLLDTRNIGDALNNGTGAPLADQQPSASYTLGIAGAYFNSISVPGNAVGALGNVTVVASAGGPGYATLVPSGAGFSGTSNINYSGNQTIANAFSVGLAGGAIDIYIGGNSAHVIIDIFGVVS